MGRYPTSSQSFLPATRPLLTSTRMSTGTKWRWLAAALAIGLSLISVADAKGFRRYLRLRQDVRSFSENNRKLAVENQQLAGQIEALRKDPKSVERAAREELGFVKPGEIVLVTE